MSRLTVIRSAWICLALAFASLTTPAFAENIDVMVVNTRSDDGVYRPALRIIRGGDVTYISAGTQGLTTAILRNPALLAAWLAANVAASNPNQPISFVFTVLRADPAENTATKVASCTSGEGGECTTEDHEAWCEASGSCGIPDCKMEGEDLICSSSA